MKLFLASEAKHPDTIKKLDNYVGGIKGKKIAYIPTAANGMGWDSWKEGGSWKLINSVDAEVELILLEENANELLINKLADKDIIWFAGGMVGYLSYWARRCSLDLYLKDILKDKVYVGSSAGSMLLCKDSDMATWEFVDNERGASDIKTLGLVDFDIYPHYEEALLPQIKKNYKGKKLYLLKNGEEIIVEDDGSTDGVKITVVGEERIISNA